MSRPPIADGPPQRPVERLRDGLGRSVRGGPIPDLTVGAPASQATAGTTPEDPDLAELARMEAEEALEPAAQAAPTDKAGSPSLPPAWTRWVIGPVVLAFALFHVAPHLADLAGEPRAVLARLTGPLPFSETLLAAAGGWLWEPTWVWLGAMALRLRTLQRMFRDPPGAAAMALIAVVFEAGFWIFMGLKQTGAYSQAEASAVTLMLQIEGAAMLGLVLLFVPLGRKKPGQTHADETAADP